MLLESSALKWRISQTQFIYLERISIFLIWTVQPRSDCLASAYGLGWTLQTSENENSISANEFCLSDSPLLSNYFPAEWNYYTFTLILIFGNYLVRAILMIRQTWF